jgi:D-serine deaminase-like pyridoxal phosphate-dependent protein
MSPDPAEIGDRITDIESPRLSVDLDALDRKIVSLAKCAPSTGACVRAHPKIRKSMVLPSVISAPAADRPIVAADLKFCSAERGLPCAHGLNGVRLAATTDERGKLPRSDSATRLSGGRKVWLIPARCGPTINPHVRCVDVRDARVSVPCQRRHARPGHEDGTLNP